MISPQIWSLPPNDRVKIVSRDIPVIPVRVESVFADRAKMDDTFSDDGEVTPLEKEREIVTIENPNAEDTNTCYEQYTIPAGCVKLGDCVYVRSDEDRPYIARVDKMWTDPK